MRAVVTGAGGLLGREVVRALRAAGADVRALAHADLDIADAASVSRCVDDVAPDVIVNCAAMTDVDECERRTAENWAANAEGPRNLARAATTRGAYLVTVSTDYVFDGLKGAPYDESDETCPVQAYGRAKLAGERFALEADPSACVLRVAWVFGTGGRNFFSRLFELARRGGPMRAVRDQSTSPTYAPDAASAIAGMLEARPSGVVHLTNAGWCTAAEFVRTLCEAAGLGIRVEEAAGSDFDRPARRPADTALNNRVWRDLGLTPMRSWQDAAAEFARAASTG